MPEGFAINTYGFGPAPSLFLNVVDSIVKNGTLPVLDPGMYAEIYGYLRANDIRFIIVGPSANQKAVCTFFTSLMGQPPVRYDDVYVWAAGNLTSKPGYFIGGDKYAAYYNNMDWIGRQIEITTYDIVLNIEISGKWRHTGLPLHITIYSKDMSSGKKIFEQSYTMADATNISLELQRNSWTQITSNRTWVPDKYIHNGDHRNLSVLFEVTRIQDANRK
jgi:hypothetical protein